MHLERMGEKSVDNLLAAIEKSKPNDLHRLIYGLGVNHIGRKVSKLLADNFGTLDKIIEAAETGPEPFLAIDDIGPKIADAIVQYFTQQETFDLINKLRNAELNFGSIEKPKPKQTEQCLVSHLCLLELYKIIPVTKQNLSSNLTVGK